MKKAPAVFVRDSPSIQGALGVACIGRPGEAPAVRAIEHAEGIVYSDKSTPASRYFYHSDSKPAVVAYQEREPRA